MLEWWLLFIPAAMLIANRSRGEEGGIGKVGFLAIGTVLAFIATRDLLMTLNWLAFLLCYAIFPWSAMFSAIHGNPPGHEDPWYADWMQKLALWIVSHALYKDAPGLTPAQFSRYWRTFGIVYGVIRASLMIPSIIAFVYLTHQPLPLIGLIVLNMGVVYYERARLMEVSGATVLDVPVAECVMGWLIGTYMLITRAAMPIDLKFPVILHHLMQ